MMKFFGPKTIDNKSNLSTYGRDKVENIMDHLVNRYIHSGYKVQNDPEILEFDVVNNVKVSRWLRGCTIQREKGGNLSRTDSAWSRSTMDGTNQRCVDAIEVEHRKKTQGIWEEWRTVCTSVRLEDARNVSTDIERLNETNVSEAKTRKRRPRK